jgi:Fe-S-cluster-containing dehydrogenase component
MVRYGMVIDTNRCTGCSNCFQACKDEYVGNDFLPWSVAQPDTQYGYYGQAAYPTGTSAAGAWVLPGQTWMKDVEVESGKFPSVQARFVYLPCLQCDNAPCLAAAKGGAIYKRPDGILIKDPTKSVGHTQLVDSCPYGQIYWNSTLQIPQKCTFCAHLIDAGNKPKCVDACPNTAITFGDLDDPNSAVAKAAASAAAFHPEYGAKPKVTYLGLISGTELR